MADVRHFGVAVTDSAIHSSRAFRKKPSPEEAISDLASTGIYVLEPEVFEYMPADGQYGFGRQLFPSLVAKGLPVLGVQVFGYWSDIGTMENYKTSSFDALKGLIDMDLPGQSTKQGWLEENAFISADADIEGLVMLGTNSRVDSGASLKGHVIMGDNCHVKSGAVIENSIIWSGATIGAHSILIDSILGNNVCIADQSVLIGEVTNDSVAPLVLPKVIQDHRISHHMQRPVVSR